MKTDSKTENQFDRIICFLTIGVFIMLTIAKIFLASQLSLFGDDESFYWLCAQHPSLAYSDHPFMTSFLILSGTKLLGNTYLGVRIIFLIMGSFIPFMIFIMARSLVGRRDAFYAAAMSMGLPLLGCMGVLAMPDVPLIFFWIISLAAFERAVRTENIRPWIVVGISIAAGINTHYRFSVFIACAGAYMLLSKTGRRQWKKFGLWIAILIAGAGLLPVVWFNITHDFAPIHFQFVNRHPGIFQPMAFLQPLKQALTVTPILYAFFIFGLIKILQRSAQGDNKSALLASFAVVPLAGYFILGLWADQKHTNVHWPLVGYLPLLVVLPGVIRDFVYLSAKKWRQSSKYIIAASAPVLGILGTLVLLGYFSIAIWPHTFNFAFKNFKRAAPYDFTGWRELKYKTESILQNLPKATVPVLATDNFSVAAELSFELKFPEPIYVLDNPRNYRFGRAYQHHIWGTDQTALLKKYPGRNVLIIVEKAKYKNMHRLCFMFESVDTLDDLYLFEGTKQFLFLYGHVLKAKENWSYSSQCDLPAAYSLDSPKNKAKVSGKVVINGWAFKNIGGIQKVEVLVDGNLAGTANYGIKRLDVKKAYPYANDPNYPNIGFNFVWKSRKANAGKHIIAVRVIPVIGKNRIVAQREVFVSH